MTDEKIVPADQVDPPYEDKAEDLHDPELRPEATDDVKIPAPDRVPSADA